MKIKANPQGSAFNLIVEAIPSKVQIFVFYLIIFGMILSWLNSQFFHFPISDKTLLGLSFVVTLLFLSIFSVYVKYIFSLCYMEVNERNLSIRLYSRFGLKEESYRLSSIDEVILGQRLNWFEAAAYDLSKVMPHINYLASDLKTQKHGLLVISLVEGDKRMFYYLNRMFSEKQLLSLFEELNNNSVRVKTVSW